ncbi:MarR family winged helix-turn-helix transcriptional regulator [Nocardia sp. NPDC003482]
MPDQPRGPLESPGFWLHHAALEWRATLERNLRPLALTPTQFNLLASIGWLARHHGPPTQQQAADMAGTDRTMASRVIRTLEDRNLLRRNPDPADARTVRLEVTSEGADLARRAVRIAVATDTELFGPHAAALRDRLRPIAVHRIQGYPG